MALLLAALPQSASGQEVSKAMPDEAFRVGFSGALRDDLRRRLRDARWSDAVTDDWQYGMDKAFLKALVHYWQVEYDYAAAERRLNSLPQFRAAVGSFGVHYLHLKGRGPRPRPLLLMNGWPSSFVEYRKLAPMLADPASFGGSPEDAFDVVMPTLPGFGFSDRPTRPHEVWPEDLFHALMTDHLGYGRYVAAGTDIGASVARHLALKHPQSLRGIHVSAVADPPLTPASRPLTEAEKAYQTSAARWEADEGSYEHVHYTKPQTLAFALADSPVGLASWIVEKFYGWTEHSKDLLQTFPADMLIDNLMIYWATETIGSSMRTYYDSLHFRPTSQLGQYVAVPTAVCLWPKDLTIPPVEYAERMYNVRQYSVQAHGGHFPAWEAPQAYLRDLQKFARSLDGN